MLNLKFLGWLKNHMGESFQFIFIGFIVAVNLLISYYIRTGSIPYVPNDNPVGFFFGYYSSVTLLIVLTWFFIELRLLTTATLGSILVLGGLYSNFLEKFVYTTVADYMSIWLATINLADIQIVLGLIILNYSLWFKKTTPSQL